MSKILVAGGAGYVGGHLVDLLLERGHEVTVYDALVYETRYLKRAEFIRGDIRDREKLGAIISDYDVVVWLAALVGDGACAVDYFLTQSLNEDTVRWLTENYSGKIVFMSTCSVYGASDGVLDETADTNPLSAYAKTKLNAEAELQEHPDHLIFRLGTLHGISDEHSRIRLDLVANILTMKAVLHEPLSVFGGEQWRPLLHVKDVAEAALFGIENEITGLYNLHEKNMQIIDIARAIQDMIPCEIKLQDMMFQDQRNYRASSDLYRAQGWMPKYTLQEGIADIQKLIEDERIKDVEDEIYSNAKWVATRYSSAW